MDRTKTKLATFFNTEDDDEAVPQKATVDDEKLAQYTQGTVRKSRREKEREREAAKQREEEALAAKTYKEYLDTFDGDGAARERAFVKAGAAAGRRGAGGGGGGFVKAGAGEAYDSATRGAGTTSQPRSGMARAFMDEEPRARSTSPAPVAPKPKGKRAMDAFLEEIKRDQAEREERLARKSGVQGRSVTALAAYESQSGSRDRGDPLTTNVFVANLPANVSEMSLGNFFAQRCGPVGSVKIMWPRGDLSHGPGADMTASRSRKSAGLSGFVSFMNRKDAETAVREIDGFDWGGFALRVGWSKAVPIASKAAYIAHGKSNSRSRSPSFERGGPHHDRRDGSRGRYDSRSRSPRRRHDRSYSRDRSRSGDRGRRRYSRSRSRTPKRMRAYSPSRSRSPWRRSDSPRERTTRTGVDPDTEKFIRMVALKVKDNGEKFEDLLRERERQNPKFTFLFDTSIPENRLYRSIIAGDSLVYGFDDDGYNSVYSTDSAEESERERGKKHKLGKLSRRRFEAMLRAMSGKRGELARCMAFSLEHAEAASEVSDIIVASLLVDSTAVPRKVARLHLICDILHNSAAAVPSAWKYRQEFQARLGIVFDHLSGIYHSFPGRITAETFKQQIIAVVDVWEDWIVFPPEYTSTLKARLEGTLVADEKDDAPEEGAGKEEAPVTNTFKFKTSSFKPAEVVEEPKQPEPTPAASVPAPANEDGEADMDLGDSDEEAKESDVDGEPIDDVDGEPIDGEPMDDIDGEPIDDDIDGVPMNDDIDGEPL